MREKISLNTIIVLLFVVVVIMGFGLSYLSGSRAPMSTQDPSTTEEEITDLLPERDPSASGSADVYYDSSATSISLEERLQISERFVAPMREYSAWLLGGDPVRTVSVRVGDENNGGQYLATIAYESGKVEDVTIARDADGISWWRPVCDSICVYPDSFAQKYPEIVKDYPEARF